MLLSAILAMMGASTEAAGFITATGGTITTDGDFKVHSFTSSGTFTVTDGAGNIEVLVVGGGGGGGNVATSGANAAAGGGAGGVIHNTSFAVTAGAYTVTVGSGGAGGTTVGVDGDDSVFDSLTAHGGGGGAASDASLWYGNDGGSGGGSTATTDPGVSLDSQGNSGGVGSNAAPNYGAGGGGGAGAAGANGTSTNGGNGGDGVSVSITGSAVTYAGGGGGGTYAGGTAGTGGSGGGGNGSTSAGNGSAGTANTGGGGGGAGSNSGTYTGGTGGSGIVIARYRFQGTRVWNSADKTANITLSNADCTATTTNTAAYDAARTVLNDLNTSGSRKLYMEFVVGTLDSSNDLYIGVRLTADTIGGNPTGSGTMVIWRSTGQIFTGGSWTDNTGGSLATYTVGDVIGLAIDEAAGKVWVAKNNTWQNSGNPAAGTNPSFSTMPSGNHAFYFSTDNTSGIVALTIQSTLSYTPPSGFTV